MSTQAVASAKPETRGYAWTTRDIIIVAVLSAIVGVANTGLSFVFQMALAGAGAIGSAFFQGMFGWGRSLVYPLVRKPGAILAVGVLGTLVAVLLGNPAGFYTLGWGILQGLAAEGVLAFVRWKKQGPWVNFIFSAVNAQFGTLWTWYLYGWSKTMDQYWLSIPLTLVSGGVSAGLLGWYLYKLLESSGLLRVALGRDS